MAENAAVSAWKVVIRSLTPGKRRVRGLPGQNGLACSGHYLNRLDVRFCPEALATALKTHGPPAIFNTDEGQPVHQRRLHHPPQGRRYPHPHGWQGALGRQRVPGTAMAQPKVRGGLTEGLFQRGRGPQVHRHLIWTIWTLFTRDRRHQSLDRRTPDPVFYASADHWMAA